MDKMIESRTSHLTSPKKSSCIPFVWFCMKAYLGRDHFPPALWVALLNQAACPKQPIFAMGFSMGTWALYFLAVGFLPLRVETINHDIQKLTSIFLTPCLRLRLGTWILSLQKRHGLLHFPQIPGLLPLQISELALEPPTSSEKPSCHHLMAWSKHSKSLKRSHTIKLWIICLSLLFRRHNPDKVFGWTWYCLPCLGFSLPAAGWKLGEIPSYLCFFARCGSHA